MFPREPIPVPPEQANLTLAAFLRLHVPGLSWNQARRLIAGRRVLIGRDVYLDPARRVKAGEVVTILPRPRPRPEDRQEITIRHLDEHVVVVEKPAGIPTVRHPAERIWHEERKSLMPTLEDLTPAAIRRREGKFVKGPLPRLRVVHRLDKETSGLVVFARTVQAERGLGKQFHDHTVLRRYIAIVPGVVTNQTIRSFLVRDRGDGRRGSTEDATLGKEAITHLSVKERLPRYTVVECRLETGRTHQIRIHLAELGHPVCGEQVYTRKPGLPAEPDPSGAPRLALHAAELGFEHPVTGEPLHWTMPLSEDLQRFLNRLRGG